MVAEWQNGNRSWAIPWMEDDLSLNGAELWVNRTLEHAALANKYGTTFLFDKSWHSGCSRDVFIAFFVHQLAGFVG